MRVHVQYSEYVHTVPHACNTSTTLLFTVYALIIGRSSNYYDFIASKMQSSSDINAPHVGIYITPMLVYI